ncbi:MAG: CPBP family intramembrane metalloprotease [Lachnospiraceae bacterium]|nr:CPBP family intramembrane metalloprotease [Lachnospiraceae bacterium]
MVKSEMRRTAEKIGYAMIIYLVVTFAVEFIIMFVYAFAAAFFMALKGEGTVNPADMMAGMQNGWVLLITSVIASYVAAPLAAYLFLRKQPSVTPEKRPLSVKDILLCAAVSLGAIYAFGYVSEGILWLTGKLFGMTTEQLNAVNALSESFTIPQYILMVCICAPIVEELFFRGFIIKKMLIHGRFAALLVSATAFGFVHGTLSQIPYALVLGFVLGYIYLRYGNILLNIFLHMLMNFIGGVLVIVLPENDITGIALTVFSILLIIAAIVIVVSKRKEIKSFVFGDKVTKMNTSEQFKESILNIGMILFVLLCLAVMIFSLFSMVLSSKLMA